MGKLTLAFLLLVILMLIAPMILYKEHFLDGGSTTTYTLPAFVVSALASSPISAAASSAYVTQLANAGAGTINVADFAYQDFINIKAALTPISGSPGFPANLALFIASTAPPAPVSGASPAVAAVAAVAGPPPASPPPPPPLAAAVAGPPPASPPPVSGASPAADVAVAGPSPPNVGALTSYLFGAPATAAVSQPPPPSALTFASPAVAVAGAVSSYFFGAPATAAVSPLPPPLPFGSPPSGPPLPFGSPPSAPPLPFGSPPSGPPFPFGLPPSAPPLPFGSPPSGPLPPPPVPGSIFATPMSAATNAAAAPTYSPASLFATPAPMNAAAAPTYSPASLFATPAPAPASPPLADGTCSDNATPCFMSNNNAKGTNSTDCPVAGNGTQTCYANPPPPPNNGTCSDEITPCYTGNNGADCPDGFQFCTLYSSPAPAPASPINPTVVANLLSNMMAQSTPPGSITPRNSSNLSSGSYQYNPITSTWAFGQPSSTNPMQFAVPMYDSSTGTYTSPSIIQGQTYQAQQAGMNPADYVRKDSIPCYGCAFPTITGNSANSCV